MKNLLWSYWLFRQWCLQVKHTRVSRPLHEVMVGCLLKEGYEYFWKTLRVSMIDEGSADKPKEFVTDFHVIHRNSSL